MKTAVLAKYRTYFGKEYICQERGKLFVVNRGALG